MSVAGPLLWTLPWTLPPIVALARALHSTSIEEFSSEAPADAPLVSIVIPARNERRNIERCARSVLTAEYPSFEVIVVDDHSDDGTGEIARQIAAEDPRLRVIDAPPLEAGWFGKQWACASGASIARGELLLFTDADTWHAPDLLPRAVNALRARRADLVTVAPHQEMHSFWERVIQPQLFGLLSLRYGGTEDVSRTRNPLNAIANGQFILVPRASYDALGGHALVRDRVAEDLSFAQEIVRAGRTIALFVAVNQMSTHMYASLPELIGGWRKNIYAGGRTATLGGALGQAFYPLILVGMPLFALLPVIVLLGCVVGAGSAALAVWSGTIVAVSLVYWALVYAFMREGVWRAVLYPLGLAMLAYIAVGAVARGRNVEWKKRAYVSR